MMSLDLVDHLHSRGVDKAFVCPETEATTNNNIQKIAHHLDGSIAFAWVLGGKLDDPLTHAPLSFVSETTNCNEKKRARK